MKAFGYSLVVRFSILLLALSVGPVCTVHAHAATPAKTAPRKPTPAAPPAKQDKSKDIYYLCTINLNPTTEGSLAAKDVIPLLGNTDPYTLKVRDSATLLVYSPSKPEPKPTDTCADYLKKKVQDIAAGHAHVEEMRVVHGSSMYDMLKAVKNLIPDKSDITVSAVGSDRIRIVRGPGVTDTDYASLKADIDRIGWQIKNESPIGRVFYVNSSDVSAAAGGKSGSKGGGSDTSGDKSGNSQTQTDTTTTTTINQVCLPQNSPAPAKPDPKAASDTASQNDSSSNSGDLGSDNSDKSGQSATPCAVTGADKAGKSDNSKSGGDQGSSPVSVTSVNDDMLVFNAARGHDADIGDKKRLLATLDFPRAEVLLNIWSFQTSSSQIKTVSESSAVLRAKINAFNSAIQESVNRTWSSLTGTLNSPKVFDSQLYPYLTGLYVGVGTGDQPLYLDAKRREQLGICPPSQYCLGYGSLFHPLKPTLTDMLMVTIVAAEPGKQIHAAIKIMEGDYAGEAKGDTCEEKDKYQVRQNGAGKIARGIPIHCFEEEADSELPDSDTNSRAGLLRAALANFLFHYKMSQQYPHEFSAYDLTQSAQELNSELSPLILAFNRDLSAMLQLLSEDTDPKLSHNGWWAFGGHGSTFINNGVITVRTLSGKSTTVDTLTQSVFDATNPPSITDLINSVGKAESNVPGVLKANLTAHEAATIIGALNSVTPARSKIGREFKINITPRSLSGASSSELQVNMDAKESSEPTLYSNGSSSTDNISRVSDHSIDTKVRLESIKLFEISSFSAFLERSRKNLPIVPPLVELPYIGSILSLPLPGAKEYHRSTAVISAITVPTAIDIVTGIRFNQDRITIKSDLKTKDGPYCSATERGNADQPCALRAAVSIGDLSPFSIGAYHRAKIACIATLSPNASSTPVPAATPAVSGTAIGPDKDEFDCNNLELSKFYPEP